MDKLTEFFRKNGKKVTQADMDTAHKRLTAKNEALRVRRNQSEDNLKTTDEILAEERQYREGLVKRQT